MPATYIDASVYASCKEIFSALLLKVKTLTGAMVCSLILILLAIDKPIINLGSAVKIFVSPYRITLFKLVIAA